MEPSRTQANIVDHNHLQQDEGTQNNGLLSWSLISQQALTVVWNFWVMPVLLCLGHPEYRHTFMFSFVSFKSCSILIKFKVLTLPGGNKNLIH